MKCEVDAYFGQLSKRADTIATSVIISTLKALVKDAFQEFPKADEIIEIFCQKSLAMNSLKSLPYQGQEPSIEGQVDIHA